MAMRDNRDILAAAGEILKRLGDKSIDLSEAAHDKVLLKLKDVIEVITDGETVAPQQKQPLAQDKRHDSDAVSSAAPDAVVETCVNTAEVPIGAFSAELLQHVDDINAGRIPPREIKENFEDHIHDRNSCIGVFLNDDLWSGVWGRKSAADFYAAISYIWVNSKEFFQPFDFDRQISEDKSRWTRQYFEEQRNYSRHNFSLERLCHLVMVYDYLQDDQEEPTSEVRIKVTKTSRSKRPFDDDSANATITSTDLRGHKKLLSLYIGGVVFLILLAILAIKIWWPTKPEPEKKDNRVVKIPPQPNIQKSPTAPVAPPAGERMEIGRRNKQKPAEKDKVIPASTTETGSEKK